MRNLLLISALVALCVPPPCHGGRKMEIRSMHIHSRVSSRFARTFITTIIQNVCNSSQETAIEMELPKTAFITNFTMIINNVTTTGIVKEKAEAKKEYQKAVSGGQNAGLVQSTGRRMENFKVSVNVGPRSTATFQLVYEELLKRQLGIYELYLRIRPKELVESFQINVDIIEPQGISFLKAVGTFMTNELSDVVRINRTENKAHIEFQPTLQQQRRCPDCVETLLDGDLMITYDVRREASAGKVQILNGYFVHYFAPANLKRLPKNVLFVIDHSGSMYGNKIKQTYEAFTKILEDMPQEDHIGLLIFDDKVDYWKKSLVRASPKNIRQAKQYVKKMTARGGTDINKALLTAAKMLTNATANRALPPLSASMILFLSDGEPTSGTTEPKKIVDNVKRSLDGQATLYCLGFGSGVDYNFLEKLALENGGLARRIYEDSDSALQLQGFYNEVANPLLLDVELQYLENSVGDLTRSSFKHYYQGSEIIVAGRIANNSAETLSAEVKAQGLSEPFSMTVEAPMQEEDEASREQRYIFGDFTERLWAYLTIEQLLTKQIAAEGEDRTKIAEEALGLSLKYNFVTPLTSMVVTPPEEQNSEGLIANKMKEQDMYDPNESALDYEDSHYFGHYDLQENSVSMDIMATVQSQTSLCETFHVILGNLDETDRICFRISEAQNLTVNLFHDERTGVTVNGKMSEDGSGFGRFGLENKRAGLKVDVNAENISVIRDGRVAIYDWTAAIEYPGILKVNNEQVTFPLDVGVNFTITLSGNSLHQSLFKDGRYSAGNSTTGVIGQFINIDVKLNSDSFSVGSKTVPLLRFPDCDFTPHGEERQGLCQHAHLSPDNLLGGAGYIVSDVFTIPQ
ncbi:inter-alpha-trypsin inhibitor heavy chain H3-like isoform X3 [Bufo gargarizans]|uniref:inter-alpha-trypsin inhibitor heavy chain H3-like isoform X3 n=1 Tax=Bufo gargarizans TaxID=30331 RepID=UPI001CF3A9F4|nr:inter-alpha-trypsin inhibitor heavy chain H3-like isoform X3 [Bufo gargarizans]